MPDLTPQDKESYEKLYNAAKDLKDLFEKISSINKEESMKLKIGDSFTLEELTKAFFDNLLPTQEQKFSRFEELQAQIELTGAYLTMYQLFAEVISNSSIQEKINQAIQELRTQYNQLKESLAKVGNNFAENVSLEEIGDKSSENVSLEVVGNNFSEQEKIPDSDALFLKLLGNQDIKDQTKQLLSDRRLPKDCNVQNLIDAWGEAVKAFVEDPVKASTNKAKIKVTPGETETIANFFRIHDQLERLYSKLP
ncbi:MAG: hypothetical protein KAF91_31825 [Nostoc sp. TH1S01]|nr:hypothetical protein [Nostoc sp. TH1S01]